MWAWVTGSSQAEDATAKEQIEGKGTSAPSGVDRPFIEGLPSPKNDMDLMMLAASLLEDVRTYGEQPTGAPWTPVEHSTPDVELWERPIPKLEQLTLLKAIGVVEGATPADILAFTLEGDLKKRVEFDPDIALLEVVKTVSPTIQVTRTHITAPYPVYPREFVDLRSWVEGDERIIFGAMSVNLEDAPFSPDHVRGNSWNGIVIDQVPGRKATKITFMGYANPQGWVPLSVLMMFRSKITERIDTFRKMVAKKAAQ